jgi:putative chitinase
MQVAQLNTENRMAFFLAQIGHETGGLRWITELWGPTPAQLRYDKHPYLGNTKPGDGRRYMGRGLIQVTGRHNYARASRDVSAILGHDPEFIDYPERVALPQYAALTAACFWLRNHLNRSADAGDFIANTKRVNGGTNGLADRQLRKTKAIMAIRAAGGM